MVIGKFTQADWDTLVMLRKYKTKDSREERVYNYILGLYKNGGLGHETAAAGAVCAA